MIGADLTNSTGLVSWREPLWLLLAFVPLLLWWFRKVLQPEQGHFADASLMPWIVCPQYAGMLQRLFSKNSAFLIAWLLFGIAASGPRLPIDNMTQEQSTDMDIMLVVDVSRSMQVTDISPSRLRRAQIEIEELLERAAGKRIGVIVFAGRPHLLAPLTSDHDALRFYLRSLDSLVLPTMGSEPGEALELAHKELTQSKNPAAIILLTDGDFSTFPHRATTLLNRAGIPLYVLGIGSVEGEAIPLKDGTWLQYDGRPVISRLNEDGLRKIADIAGGGIDNDIRNNYSPVLDDDSDWKKIYDDGVNGHSTSSKKIIDDNIIWQQLYHWPLFFALLLLWLALVPYELRLPSQFAIRSFVRRPFSRIKVISSAKSVYLVAIIILLNFYPQQTLHAANTATLKHGELINESQAFREYSSGNFPQALAIYKQLTGYSARFGEASSYYKMAEYNSALRQYTQAALVANTDGQRAVALFNLGNSYFKMGNYDTALMVYRDAIQYQPGHKKILHNIKFTSELKKSVSKRLQDITQASRMGSGPQREAVSGELENNQNASLAVDESENQKVEEYPLPELANISNARLEALINRGLAQIKLAAEDRASIEYKGHGRTKLAFINAHLRMAELKDQQQLLWKQLFEMEEGFPATLSEPRQIPGVAPW